VAEFRRLDSSAPDFAATLARLTASNTAQDEAIDTSVANIVADVRMRGDAAVLEYTALFDRVKASSVATLEILAPELAAAFDSLDRDTRDALVAASGRIREFHEHQRGKSASSWEMLDADGTRMGQQVNPLERVGLYVPGGKAAYPSSVLMNAIPGKVAGVAEIIMVVPTPGGARNPLVLAAAHLAGVTRAFAIGGAQAVAALAYGTATIPAVDKIVGPGNAYVAAAKRRVFGAVGIDMIAGPSEILIIADASANPEWVAMDLFAQAEHDEMAQAILLTPDAALLDAVAESMARELPTMPRKHIIAASIAKRGALVRVRDLVEACHIANTVSPEHLELAVQARPDGQHDGVELRPELLGGDVDADVDAAAELDPLGLAGRVRFSEANQRDRGIPKRRPHAGQDRGYSGARRRTPRACGKRRASAARVGWSFRMPQPIESACSYRLSKECKG